MSSTAWFPASLTHNWGGKSIIRFSVFFLTVHLYPLNVFILLFHTENHVTRHPFRKTEKYEY